MVRLQRKVVASSSVAQLNHQEPAVARYVRKMLLN